MSAVPLSLAFEAFNLDCQSRNLQQTSIDFYKFTLTPFLKYLDEKNVSNIGDISSAHIRAFIVLIGRDWKPNTQHAHARSIRAFLNFCVREEWLAKSPMSTVRMPKLEKKILPSFTQEEIGRILRVCECERDKAIVLFLLDTGCRVSELANIQITDIDMARGEVIIRQGKGAKDRYTYFGPSTKKQLMRYFVESGQVPEIGALWHSRVKDRDSFTMDGVKNLMKALKRATGIPHLSAHTFRRTFAIQSLRSGMNIFVLQRLMGHSDLETLKGYLSLLKSDLEAAHRQHGIVEQMAVGR